MTHQMRHAVRALAVALFAAVALCALAAPCLAGQPVRVGVYNFAPLVFVEEGQAKGFFVDMLHDLARREGWELTFVPGTWAECLGRLKGGEIDLLPSIAQTPEREEDFAFTEGFLFLDWGVVYTKKGSTIRTVFDLEGKAVAALSGAAATQSLKSLLEQFGVKASIVNKHEYAAVMDSVARGDVDAGVCLNIVGSGLEQSYAVERTDIVFSPVKLRSAVKKGGREDLLPALDRHLAELKASPGSLYYQLRGKWLGLPGEPMLPGWARWAIGVFVAALGVLAAFVVFLRLLAARRTRELAASQAKYRALVEDQTELVSRFTAEGVFLYVNPAFCRFFGKAEAELLGTRWAPVVFEEDLPRVREELARLGPRQPVVSVENRNVNAAGEVRWLQFTNRAIFDARGDIAEIQSVGRDITERKRAEQALRESEAFTRAIMEHLPIGIAVNSVDPAVSFQYMNENFLRFYRTTREALARPDGFWEAAYEDPDDRERMRRRVLDDCASGDPARMVWTDVALSRAGQPTFYISARNVPVPERGLMISTVWDVTAHKRAEQALAESEGRLSLAVGMARLGHWELDLDAGMFTFSDSFYAIYHTTAQAMGGYAMSVADYAGRFVHPEDRALVAEEVRQAMAAEDPGFTRFIEHRCLYADGGVGHVAVRIAVVKDASGKTVRTHGVNQDITELRQAEAALAENRRVLEMILNTVPQSIFWKDENSVYQGCNQAFARAAGLAEPGGISGRTDFDLPWTREESEAYRAADRKIMATGQGKRNYVEAQTQADGRTVWVETSKLPLVDGSGRAVGVMGIYEDISERKLTEETLQFLVLCGCDGSGEAFFPSLARYLAQILAMDFVCIDRLEEDGLAAQTVAVFHDGHFEGNVRYSLADTPCGELVESRVCFHPEGVRQHFPNDQILQDMRAESYAGVILWDHLGRPIGLIAVIGRRAAPDRARIESVLRLVGVRAAAELERLDAQSQLLKAKEAAEAASRAKGEFLANMSHELRTPMNGVLGMLQLLMLEKLRPAQQDYAHKAFEAADRLLSLLNDILDFSRIEAGVLVFKNERFHPADLLAAASDVFGLICGRKGLALEIAPDAHLPGALMGDEARIRQVIFNLVGNAVKFTDTGGVRIQAWYNPESGLRPGYLCIAVSDSGVGIPADKLAGIFDRFSQADASYTRQYEGAGLGLAIVRRIVASMGGSLCIESEQGQGTSAVLVLPAPPAAPAAVARPAGGEACARPETVVPLRILLAEDELIGQLGARVLLERMGHRVVAVNDGRSAVEKVLEGGFDCVLMDIQMPEMDGLEATRIIRSTSLPGVGRIPIVAMTAYALSGDREKFLAAGMDGYIAKPFQQEELRQVLCMVAGMLHQGREAAVRPG